MDPTTIGATVEAEAPAQESMAPVDWQKIEDSFGRHSRLEIVEKAQMSELAINAVLGGLTGINVDLPNKYSIKGEDGQELVYAAETTSVWESTFGWDYALDVAYTEGGVAEPIWKLRGDLLETTIADASSGEVIGSVAEYRDSWCCCAKGLTTFLCHEKCVAAVFKCVCGCGMCEPWWCCCCECCCEICICCCDDQTYIHKKIEPGRMQAEKSSLEPSASSKSKFGSKNFGNKSKSFGGGKSSELLDGIEAPEEAEIAIKRIAEWYSVPCWLCRGNCGEGSMWAIVKDARINKMRKPFTIYDGTQIGTLSRKGTGCVQTWICPGSDKDHWTLTFDPSVDSKTKLAALSTVLFMDHANQDQANDAD